MSSIQYNETEAVNFQSSYKQYDVLDFMITADPSQDLQANSVCLNFDLQVKADGARVSNKEIFFDKNAGAHCFIDSVSTSTSSGQLEHITEYSRNVAMHNVVSKTDNDLFNTTDILELVCAEQTTVKDYCEGVKTAGTGASFSIVNDKSVSLHPKCVLNKMNGNLNFSKVGFVKLSITLNKNITALFGNHSSSNIEYLLHNVKLQYMTVPSVPQNCIMNSVICLKQSINSSNSNISVKVPGISNSMSAVFLKQSEENDLTKNSQKLERLPEVKSVQFMFNDSINNNFISYSEEDYGEIVENFIDSVSGTMHNRVGANTWKGAHFGIGQNWGKMIDLSQSKFNIQIQTNNGVNASTPFLIYMYFKSMVQV